MDDRIRVLFICRDISRDHPAAIRARSLATQLAPEFRVDVLSTNLADEPHRLSNFHRSYSYLEDVADARAECSRFARWRAGLRLATRAALSFGDPRVRVHTDREPLLAMAKLLELDAANHYSAVIVTVPPWSFYLLAHYRALRGRVVFDVNDPLFGNACGDQMAAMSGTREVYERRSLRRAARVLTTTSETTREFVSRYGLQDDAVVTIPQGVDSSTFRRWAPPPLARGTFRFIYAGAFYHQVREPWPLLSAFRSLQEAHSEVALDIYGGFNYSHTGQDDLRSRAGRGVTLCRTVDQASFASEYLSSHAAILLENAYGHQRPGKTYELLWLGIPLVWVGGAASSLASLATGNPRVVLSTHRTESISSALASVRATFGDLSRAPARDYRVDWASRALPLARALRALCRSRRPPRPRSRVWRGRC